MQTFYLQRYYTIFLGKRERWRETTLHLLSSSMYHVNHLKTFQKIIIIKESGWGGSINTQKPSTLDRRDIEDEDFLLSCRSISSNDEQERGGRDNGKANGLVGEIDGLFVGGDGEKLNLVGAGVMIPLRLGDLDIFFPLNDPGSWSGNRDVNLMSCMTLRCSTMVLIVGLSDGSFWRHLWAISATIRAALDGNRPFSWGSMMSDSLLSSAK